MHEISSIEIEEPADSGFEIIDQLGGSIAACNGVPISSASVQQASSASLGFLGSSLPWMAPLIEAAVRNQTRGSARFLNAWGDGQQHSDRPRYEAHVAYVREQLSVRCPWLLALFDGASALVLVSPTLVSFSVPQHLGVSFDCPEIVPLIPLDPAEPESGEHLH
jgi:hypothetical protein